MYFSQLKYIALAATAATLSAFAHAHAATPPQLLIVPPLFEDFPGPSSIDLHSFPARGGFSSCWKLETLVPAAELGEGAMVIRKLGLRADESAGPGPHRLRGAVTLSTTKSARLSARFGDNAAGSPVTFFVASRSEPARAGRRAERMWLDLPGGFRFDPATDGNLLVHLELQTQSNTLLDVAPAAEPRLLVASDFLTPAGELSQQALVLVLEVVRELPKASADVAGNVIRPVPFAAPGAAGSAKPTAAVNAQIAALESRLAGLESQLAAMTLANQSLASKLEGDLGSISALVTAHYVESALASGRPGPAMLASDVDGGRLAAARKMLVQAVEIARAGSLDVRGASRLLEEGDARLLAGERGLAFVSWSLAFRSVLSLWRPYESPVPRVGFGSSSRVDESGDDAPLPEVPRVALGRRAAPYDLVW